MYVGAVGHLARDCCEGWLWEAQQCGKRSLLTEVMGTTLEKGADDAEEGKSYQKWDQYASAFNSFQGWQEESTD